MKWRKQGLIYGPDGRSSWAKHGCLTPTPLLMEDVIRVYVGLRDAEGVSRIGYVDVAAGDPRQVLRVSPEPVLDVGQPGCFDDNGVILGDVVADGSGDLRMYYVGFQKVARAKFIALTGLAISRDGGTAFERLQQAPVLERADEGLFIRAVHTARHESGEWRIWYAAGSGWEMIGGIPYPRYHIRHLVSSDGIVFPRQGDICLEGEGSEYRIGRPRVYRCGEEYRMIFTKGRPDGDYTPGLAVSPDGRRWIRDDRQLGIGPSPAGWDSKHLCYPSIIRYRDRVWMFYNGNNMGADGFGYAELVASD